MIDYGPQQIYSHPVRKNIVGKIMPNPPMTDPGHHSMVSREQTGQIIQQKRVSKQASGSGVAQSAQAGFHNKRDGIDGLHSSKDPDPHQMTHSAAFDNYKRHGGNGGSGNNTQQSVPLHGQSKPKQ